MGPQETKPFIDEIRAAVRWLDKNAAIISQSHVEKQSGELSEFLKKRGMFVGRFLIGLDPKQSPLSAASRQRWEALTPHYYIDNPVSKRLTYYETQRLQERVRRAIARSPNSTATFAASKPTTTSVTVEMGPQETKPFIDEIRAAVRWLDKNAAIISQSHVEKQSGELSEFLKKRGMFVGRFLIGLDPKQSPLSAASRQRWEALTPHYYIDNPVSKRLTYYETQRLQERVRRAIARSPNNKASINERHRRRLQEMKQRMETIELRVEFTGPHIDVTKVKELRKQKGNVVCEVAEVLVATDEDVDAKSSERIYKRYIRRITVRVIGQK